jgi:hypothetical protein
MNDLERYYAQKLAVERQQWARSHRQEVAYSLLEAAANLCEQTQSKEVVASFQKMPDEELFPILVAAGKWLAKCDPPENISQYGHIKDDELDHDYIEAQAGLYEEFAITVSFINQLRDWEGLPKELLRAKAHYDLTLAEIVKQIVTDDQICECIEAQLTNKKAKQYLRAGREVTH